VAQKKKAMINRGYAGGSSAANNRDSSEASNNANPSMTFQGSSNANMAAMHSAVATLLDVNEHRDN